MYIPIKNFHVVRGFTFCNFQDDGRIPENFEFDFGNGVHGQLNFGFDFNSSNENKQNDIENKLHYPQVDAKVGSDENSWTIKDAFSKGGSNDKVMDWYNLFSFSTLTLFRIFYKVFICCRKRLRLLKFLLVWSHWYLMMKSRWVVSHTRSI